MEVIYPICGIPQKCKRTLYLFIYIMSVNSKVCIQRRFQFLYNNPPPRLTPTSPYKSGEYTKEQLDMRRKAEVLQGAEMVTDCERRLYRTHIVLSYNDFEYKNANIIM
jgi:hypothetical protein